MKKTKINILFGYFLKLEFLQNLAQNFFANLSPFVSHNLEKYYVIKKALYLSSIENITGDYLEFGIFEGSSFSNAIRCYLKLKKIIDNKISINFYGFDSFEGFGELSEKDKHPIYKDLNFETSYKNVFQRINKVSKNKVKFKLIKGFFSETLIKPPSYYGIKKARIIFVDSDTYLSTFEALNFCITIIQPGTIFILDDFFSYSGSSLKGVAGAFFEFKKKNNLFFREICSYGMGGKMLILDSKSNM